MFNHIVLCVGILCFGRLTDCTEVGHDPPTINVTKPTNGDGPLGTFPDNQPEGVLPGAKLEATTTDSGGITRYDIMADTNPGTTFSIDSTGQLSLVTGKTFDFTMNPQYVLKINVTDAEPVTVTATATITINEGPKFANNRTVSIDNGAAVGTSVTTYAATDVEDDTITYSIVEGNTGTDFNIANSSTGDITVAKVLNFTRTPTYTLKVKAEETTPFIQDTTGTVTISVCEAKCSTDGSSTIRMSWVQAVFMIATTCLFFVL